VLLFPTAMLYMYVLFYLPYNAYVILCVGLRCPCSITCPCVQRRLCNSTCPHNKK